MLESGQIDHFDNLQPVARASAKIDGKGLWCTSTPVASMRVFFSRSEPARSTNDSLPVMTLPVTVLVLSMRMLNTRWEQRHPSLAIRWPTHTIPPFAYIHAVYHMCTPGIQASVHLPPTHLAHIIPHDMHTGPVGRGSRPTHQAPMAIQSPKPCFIKTGGKGGGSTRGRGRVGQ